jgi:hypothetical protein
METGGSSVIRTQGKGVGLETALAHAASGDAARSEQGRREADPQGPQE